MPFAFLNIVAGVVYALALPFVALVTAYVYFDARARGELEPVQPPELPAEIELSPPESLRLSGGLRRARRRARLPRLA